MTCARKNFEQPFELLYTPHRSSCHSISRPTVCVPLRFLATSPASFCYPFLTTHLFVHYLHPSTSHPLQFFALCLANTSLQSTASYIIIIIQCISIVITCIANSQARKYLIRLDPIFLSEGFSLLMQSLRRAVSERIGSTPCNSNEIGSKRSPHKYCAHSWFDNRINNGELEDSVRYQSSGLKIRHRHTRLLRAWNGRINYKMALLYRNQLRHASLLRPDENGQAVTRELYLDMLLEIWRVLNENKCRRFACTIYDIHFCGYPNPPTRKKTVLMERILKDEINGGYNAEFSHLSKSKRHRLPFQKVLHFSIDERQHQVWSLSENRLG